ncbi:hypothetical protein HaLaN_08152, partial [Haematococcus lacustris]
QGHGTGIGADAQVTSQPQVNITGEHQVNITGGVNTNSADTHKAGPSPDVYAWSSYPDAPGVACLELSETLQWSQQERRVITQRVGEPANRGRPPETALGHTVTQPAHHRAARGQSAAVQWQHTHTHAAGLSCWTSWVPVLQRSSSRSKGWLRRWQQQGGVADPARKPKTPHPSTATCRPPPPGSIKFMRRSVRAPGQTSTPEISSAWNTPEQRRLRAPLSMAAILGCAHHKALHCATAALLPAVMRYSSTTAASTGATAIANEGTLRGSGKKESSKAGKGGPAVVKTTTPGQAAGKARGGSPGSSSSSSDLQEQGLLAEPWEHRPS